MFCQRWRNSATYFINQTQRFKLGAEGRLIIQITNQHWAYIQLNVVWFLAAAIAKNHNTLQQVDTGKIYWKPCSHLMVWFSAAAASKSPSCRILALQSSVCSTREMLQSSHCASNTLMQSSHCAFSTSLQSSHSSFSTLMQSLHCASNTLQQSSHRTFSALMQWLLYYFWHTTAKFTLSHSLLWSWISLQYVHYVTFLQPLSL